jgi:hypothetical protein
MPDTMLRTGRYVAADPYPWPFNGNLAPTTPR